MKKIRDLIRPSIADILPYPPGKPIEEVKRELGLNEVIKLASNENALGPSPKAIEAIKKAVGDINIYPDGNSFYLKQKIAQKLNVGMDEIFMGNGTDEVIRVITEAFLNPDEEVVIAWPGFVIYSIATNVMAGTLKSTTLKNYTHDLEAMLDAVTDKTKLLFIANPNNPTGTIVDKTQVEFFMKKVPEDVIVVFDEAYYEYAGDNFPDTIQYMREGRNVIILRTFSKIYGLAGLRVGYGIAKKEIFAEMNRIRQPFNVNRLAQAAAIAALDDEQQIKKSKAMNEEGKKFLYKELESFGLEYVPTSANFILVNMARDGKEVFEKLLREGVIVRPMGSYDMPNFIRVTIGKLSDNIKFIESLKKILK
ncbi:MAG: histidinol-phosphate transaminase [Candidatus Omnitrophica bacterium]|nr:histidinol-phosphate transaminase [Candidatus Omnitrophota bacterium]MBU1889015.1 histidinol-phosphate transaminase [Candidatus Omnitrophota bacterium]